jgi:hypothetical protein
MSRPPSLRYGAPLRNVCDIIELGRDVGLAESGAHPYRFTTLRLIGRALLLECFRSFLKLIWGYVFHVSRNAPRITEWVFDC